MTVDIIVKHEKGCQYQTKGLNNLLLCDKPHHAKGYCRPHYDKIYRNHRNKKSVIKKELI